MRFGENRDKREATLRLWRPGVMRRPSKKAQNCGPLEDLRRRRAFGGGDLAEGEKLKSNILR
jgi:hypothetical protein